MAGFVHHGTVLECSEADWEFSFDLNVKSMHRTISSFLPAMLAHGEPCHIVNTASMAGLGSAPMMGPYNISKYGVVALSETLSREMQLMKTAVGVSVLCPAFVATGIATSDRNMPVEIAEKLPVRTGPGVGTQSMIESLVANGMSTEVVADEVLDAIQHERFWILTHEASKASVTTRAAEIVNGINPTLNLGFT